MKPLKEILEKIGGGHLLREAKYGPFKSKHRDNNGGAFTADKIIDDKKNDKWRVDMTLVWKGPFETVTEKKAIHFDKSDFPKEKNVETVIKKVFKDPFSAAFWGKRVSANKQGQGGYMRSYDPKSLFTLGQGLYRKSGN